MTCKDMVCLMYYGIGGVAAGMTAEGNPHVFNPQTSRIFVIRLNLIGAASLQSGRLA
jgi:hypothetical protein